MAAAIPLAMMAASTAVSVYGAIAQGNAQKSAYDFNAQQQQIQGQQQRNIDISKAQAQGVDNERRLGQITAAYGAAGVDPNSGTPLEVASDQASHDEMARQQLLWEGIASQQSSDTQASADQAQGSAAQQAGYVSALGNLFSGAGKIASSPQAMSW